MSFTDTAILKTIETAVNQGRAVAIEPLSDGTSKVKTLGLGARIWHWRDTQFHEARLSGLAFTVAKVLEVQQRVSIAEAAESKDLQRARNILKKLRVKIPSSPDIQQLKREITAAKLGISATTLECNQGLQEFAEKYHLERYLLGYQHTLQVDQANQKVSLLKEGCFQPWEQIHEDVKKWTQPKRSPPHWTWVYGEEGVQHKDFYDWTELKPFMKGNPADWDHQYVFEFCACQNPNSIKNGNHSWLRLKSPNGDIYSIGLYRPEKMGLMDNLKTPFRIKPGFLMQPDVSEFWDFPISTVNFKISEESFLKIKQSIEADKKNEDTVFQLFNNNCLLYSKKLAKIAGVDLPTGENVLNLISPPGLKNRVAAFMEKLPTVVQKVCSFVVTVFANLLQIALGGCRIDKDLNPQQKKRAVPHFQSIRELGDSKKLELHHPTAISFKVLPAIQAWRQQEIGKMRQTESDPQKQQAEERRINLSLPPAYYAFAT